MSCIEGVCTNLDSAAWSVLCECIMSSMMRGYVLT